MQRLPKRIKARLRSIDENLHSVQFRRFFRRSRPVAPSVTHSLKDSVQEAVLLRERIHFSGDKAKLNLSQEKSSITMAIDFPQRRWLRQNNSELSAPKSRFLSTRRLDSLFRSLTILYLCLIIACWVCRFFFGSRGSINADNMTTRRRRMRRSQPMT